MATVTEDFQKLVPGFRLNEIIGKGSFSEVYRATDVNTSEVLALKCFRQRLTTTSLYHSAASEIAFMKILDHPNIISLKACKINKEFAYIGTEFAAFGSLNHYMHKRNPMPESVIQHVMKQLISALEYMHALGVFHGDIKPHNIFCTNMNSAGPFIKIGDFGLTTIKLSGTVMTYRSGSFLYMAPEVHLKYPVDVTCDVWSAGVVLYAMMFRRSIFGFTETNRAMHITYLKRRATPNYIGGDSYSTSCNDLLKKLLTYDKQCRPHGEALRKHPFLNIDPPKIAPRRKFVEDARDHINAATDSSKNKEHGEALIAAMQAVYKLKIHFNLLPVDGEEIQTIKRFLKSRWIQYEQLIATEEKALVTPDIPINDNELRKQLISTPRLLEGFDIGCNAELFLMDGKKTQALPMFHQALQILLPLIKNEPKSARKDMLSKRLEKWIEDVEQLTAEQNSQNAASRNNSQ